jgi:hypothetical protein
MDRACGMSKGDKKCLLNVDRKNPIEEITWKILA